MYDVKQSFLFVYTEKPSIDVSKIKDITVRAGQELRIPVPIKGWPVPTAVWELNGKEVEKGPRVKIEVLLEYGYSFKVKCNERWCNHQIYFQSSLAFDC